MLQFINKPENTQNKQMDFDMPKTRYVYRWRGIACVTQGDTGCSRLTWKLNSLV